MKPALLTIALLLAFNAPHASASIPAYLSKVIEIATFKQGTSSAGSIAHMIDGLTYQVKEIDQFRGHFRDFARRDAHNTESLLGKTFIPVGQTLVNGNLRQFTAINFYMLEQVRTIDIAIGAMDARQLSLMMTTLENSGVPAFSKTVSAAKSQKPAAFNTPKRSGEMMEMQNFRIPMRNGDEMQIQTLKIRTSELDQADLEMIVHELRSVLE